MGVVRGASTPLLGANPRRDLDHILRVVRGAWSRAQAVVDGTCEIGPASVLPLRSPYSLSRWRHWYCWLLCWRSFDPFHMPALRWHRPLGCTAKVAEDAAGRALKRQRRCFAAARA